MPNRPDSRLDYLSADETAIEDAAELAALLDEIETTCISIRDRLSRTELDSARCLLAHIARLASRAAGSDADDDANY